jgi:MoaA/NifB/PqqE/SkfB family radical SAM enzyme
LGIDLTGVCNIKPPCVYCAWDLSKEREGGNVELPFNLETLSEYGDFFEGASELVNCSIGEPFMMKDIDALLDAFGQRGKMLEVTTNGQILTDTNIRKLLGRNAHLYISLDASTSETYARLRNARFEQVVQNVRRLVEAKGGPGNLPLVYLVFMPMKANVHETEDFVALCADLRVDRLVLRPLNASPGTELVFDRAGYHYDYQSELLPFDELVRVSGRVAELSRRLGVELSDQMDFGGEMGPAFAELYEAGRREIAARFEAQVQAPPAQGAPPGPESPLLAAPPPSAPPPLESVAADDAPVVAPKLPICTEPWTSLYVLRRGTLPCCYGGAAVAPMQGFQQAWNSPLLQDIRRELRTGRFHRYCFDSPDCPLVRKSEEHRDLSVSQAALLRGTRLWTSWKRAGFGLPGSVYRRAKHLALNAAAHLRRT